MAAIDDIISRISESDIKKDLLKEIEHLRSQKKFGLVFEEHLPEFTRLYELPVKKGCLVALRETKSDDQRKTYYRVKDVKGNKAVCIEQNEGMKEVVLAVDEIVAIALFGQPIYPCLTHVDEVKNAPDSDLWHTLIEAENYHALQLLAYLYGGMVDCIYIDPPYNTGDKSWKYNNDYVDDNDSYRHSKWLSMMKKRLLLAKKLLNPQDSVLIVTIDEKEYLRLGCLLEELFPDAKSIQMISSVINPAGVSRGGEFARTDEYLFVVMIGNCAPEAISLSKDWRGNIKGGYKDKLRWNGLQRSGTSTLRRDRVKMFYPIYLNTEGTKIVEVGQAIPLDIDRKTIPCPPNMIQVWPLFPDGREGRWRLGRNTLIETEKKHYVRIGKLNGENTSLTYLAKGEQRKVERGDFPIIGYSNDGSIIVDESNYDAKFVPGTQWWISSHDATQLGTKILNSIIGSGKFDFPKSIYAVHDVLRFFVANKPDALIVDFFAGSGTTLHAVNLLNAEDGGKRRCIMVTNNEVSAEEEQRLKAANLQPGMEEWEKWGIARYVNWPRTKYSILGQNVNGEPLKGNYQTYLKHEKEKGRLIKQITLVDNPDTLKAAQKKELIALCCQGKLPQNLVKADSKFIVSDEHVCSIIFDTNYAEEWLEEMDGQDQVTEIYIVTRNNQVFKQLKAEVIDLLGNIVEEEPVSLPMSDGFAANVKYFKLGFLDKNAVALNRQFKELLTMLWMKAGSKGECPTLEGDEIPDYMICEKNSMAILINDTAYATFYNLLKDRTDIKTIYFVEDSEYTYTTMAQPFQWAKTYQLYRDYLDNFTINYER